MQLSGIFLTSLALLVACACAHNAYECARCVAYDRKCNGHIANTAKNWCRPGRAAHEQDPCCKAQACHYCIHHRHVDICRYSSLTHQCFQYWGQATSYKCQNGHTTRGLPWGHHGNNHHHGHQHQHHGHHKRHGNHNHDKHHHHNHHHHTHRYHGNNKKPNNNNHNQNTNSAGCTWRQGHGKHSIVINPSRYAHGNWKNTGDSITYKPGHNNPHQIDGAGSSTISFKFAPSVAGEYRLTAKTYAPHSTEYNDMWIRFSGGQGVKLTKHGHAHWRGGWHKAYQNSYSSYDLYTKDHDPHSIVTPWLNKGQTYTVDIAGRSSRFKLERIIIKNTHHLHDHDMTVSQCY